MGGKNQAEGLSNEKLYHKNMPPAAQDLIFCWLITELEGRI